MESEGFITSSKYTFKKNNGGIKKFASMHWFTETAKVVGRWGRKEQDVKSDPWYHGVLRYAEWRQALECRGCEMNERTEVVDSRMRLISHKKCSLEKNKNKRWKKHLLVLLTTPSHRCLTTGERSCGLPHRLTLGHNTELSTVFSIKLLSQTTDLPVGEWFALIRQLTFPLLDFQLAALKALVVRLRFRLVLWIVILREVRVGQSFGRCYPLICVQHKHFLQQVHR